MLEKGAREESQIIEQLICNKRLFVPTWTYHEVNFRNDLYKSEISFRIIAISRYGLRSTKAVRRLENNNKKNIEKWRRCQTPLRVIITRVGIDANRIYIHPHNLDRSSDHMWASNNKCQIRMPEPTCKVHLLPL